MEFTAGQAAIETKSSKPTISRALKSGDLSGRKMPDGSYRIDAAELMRWNAERSRRGPQLRIVTDPDSSAKHLEPEPGPLMLEVAELRVKLAAADLRERETRETLSAVIDDLRKDRDEWREQAKAAVRLAPPPVEEGLRYTGNETFIPKPPPPSPRSEIATEGDRKPAERGSWFSRLLGRQSA